MIKKYICKLTYTRSVLIMIPLKVGDKLFNTSETTLKKSEYFNSLLSRWNRSEIELDEDPRLFRHFLNCLRHDTYEIPDKYRANVCCLLDYYGVKYNHDSKPIIWKAKYVLCKGKDIKFTFNGKLANIRLYNGLHKINIIFNGISILSDIDFFELVKTERHIREFRLNKSFITNLKELEGNFVIEAEIGDNSSFEIFYFER